MKWLAVACLAPVASSAAAQPLDCDHLLHSKVPFQITRKAGDFVSYYQVYRSDNLMATAFASQKQGGVNKSITQGGLVKSSIAPNGKHLVYTYDLKPKKFYFDELRHLSQTTRIDDYTAKPFREDFEMKNEDDLSVGPCIVHVFHFLTKYPDNTIGVQSSETWYSKDLMATIKSVRTMKDKVGKFHAEEAEATDITTDFQPLK